MSDSRIEISKGKRFAFGKNWSRFLEVLDEDRIHTAEISLQSMLRLERLDGLSFLDAGCGSGLFSLAAWRLGAKVHSFDYDPESVATAQEMRRRYCNDAELWRIESGSVLDTNYLGGLGQFDIVYSWGVLHHTGNMWQAMDNVISLVTSGGHLFIALYNDQDFVSRFWNKIKSIYCFSFLGRMIIIPVFFVYFTMSKLISDCLRMRNPLRRYTEYRRSRGMSVVHNWVDWLGGYPYETAKPGEVFDFYVERGFSLTSLVTCQSLGCNEFVFTQNAGVPSQNRVTTDDV